MRARRFRIDVLAVDKRIRLQRGRALARAEMRAAVDGGCLLKRASTGPRTCARGDPLAHRGSRAGVLRFNGAAHLRARRYGPEAERAPRTLASTGPRTCARGDGRAHHHHSATRRASTGPRTCARGDITSIGSASSTHRCFNGAAHLRARRLEVAMPRVRRIRRFNGAAHLRARRFRRRSRRSSRGSRFNGAAHLRARRYAQQRHERHAERASTGPRTCARGDL